VYDTVFMFFYILKPFLNGAVEKIVENFNVEFYSHLGVQLTINPQKVNIKL
tara:strand:- start:8 stop:160 length:153 start_codon:yes stop_codon:yes gene_type:complete